MRLRLSSCFVAYTKGPEPQHDEATLFWLATGNKILARSPAPYVPRPVEEALWVADVNDWAPQQVIDAAFHSTTPADVSTCSELHPTWEVPFWATVADRSPTILPWLTPQAPLEALADLIDDKSRRWVDFLWYPPPTPTEVRRPIVIEIDGAGHESNKLIDKDRDQALAQSGIRVGRIIGPQLENLWNERPELGPLLDEHQLDRPDLNLLRQIHGPSAFTRVAAALLLGVETGNLRPGEPWRIAISDQLGVAGRFVNEAENLLRAVDDLWETQVMATQIDWVSCDPGESPDDADLLIRLEPFTAPHARLAQLSSVPEIVMRSAHLPFPLQRPTTLRPSARRTPVGVDKAEPILAALLDALFGHDHFREGQLESLHRAVSGDDSVVLLPTGSGKSLIYQMAGILQPGLVLIIDPLQSLIDDQTRRLVENGVDHVLGLHSGKANHFDADRISNQIGSGDFDFIFVTPERLQIQRFRDALQAATDKTVVALAVIDEAHCVSEWGHDFRPSYLRLGRNLRLLCRGLDDREPPLLALTATASPTILQDLLTDLDLEEGTVQSADSHDRPNLLYEISYDFNQLSKVLTNTIERVSSGPETPSGIIFTPTVRGQKGLLKTRDLAAKTEYLTSAEISMYSGRAPSEAQEKTWGGDKAEHAHRFITGETALMVSTKAFGMGIDKPDIRYTLHRGMPSSIEAFAQESGRAGRDFKPSRCCLLTTGNPSGIDPVLLDPAFPLEIRRAAWDNSDDLGDLGTQFYFHYSSFGAEAKALDAAIEVLNLIWSKPTSRVSLPRSNHDEVAKLREFGLIRLMRIGLVDDYTIDYGAKKFTVDLANFDADSVDAATFRYVTEIDPGRNLIHKQTLDLAPEKPRARVEHHLRWVIERNYAIIEPARLRALGAMYDLAQSGDGDQEIHERIGIHLGDGPLRSVLTNLINDQERLDAQRLKEALSVVYSPIEWIGASARQLELTPNHPAALLAAAIAELVRADGRSDQFEPLATQAFANLAAFGVNDSDSPMIFAFLLERARAHRAKLAASVWRAWPDRSSPGDQLVAYENEVLEKSAEGRFEPTELDEVLARRIRRNL